MRWAGVCSVGFLTIASFAAQPAVDTLGRGTPRSSVTAFLEACRKKDFGLASQYLDLGKEQISGPEAARKIEAALNASPHFSVTQLSANSDANSGAREAVVTISQNGASGTLYLEQKSAQPPIWVFAPDSVALALRWSLSPTTPSWAHFLPSFLTAVTFLETPLWQWLILILAALILLSLSRHLDRILRPCFDSTCRRFLPQVHWSWTQAVIRPVRVLVSLAIFRVVMEVIGPSAIARLYLGRAVELIAIWAIAWGLIRIVDLLLNRVESNMAQHQQVSGRSILRLGRRTASVTIVVVAILMILSSWGYNTATLVAGLGVGGIAVALAAQQTIANVFGGISVIGDRPVSIGDYGKFGDLVGTVEDIGMRSTRVRTLNRTLVSVPNSTFAGANLENYSRRDKILFNPTLQIKRSTPDDEVWRLIDSLREAIARHKDVELVPTPVRLTALTAASFNIEVFCYVLTADIDRFYRIQGELLLALNDALQAAHLELV